MHVGKRARSGGSVEDSDLALCFFSFFSLFCLFLLFSMFPHSSPSRSVHVEAHSSVA